ncbi:MAG: beta-ketoacyl-ACP synthase II [Lachnospiraceae bacterium]|nr:beta-ketoacyl-ACP synthase II [Lachnospiraceae bacterium]
MEKRKVVVTGLGTINPTGNTVSDSWANIRQGVCGIGEITAFDASEYKVKMAGEVKDFDPTTCLERKEIRHMARFTQLAMVAADEALADSGLITPTEETPRYCAPINDSNPTRCGVIISCGIGGLDVIEDNHDKGLARGFEKVSPFFIPMSITNMAAARVAISHGLKGMCTCPVTACAGGSNAIGDAFHRIRDGYEDVMVCGGAESAVTPLAIGGFSNMKALSLSTDPATASIPFDLNRGGFVLGEGAGMLVLEEMEHAKARGAKIYAEIVGYGSNCDAYHITSPAPDGSGGAACMELAIEDASLKPQDIDYINAHGTSTHMNDLCETMAIHKVFGDYAKDVAISSTKSMTGHLLGGAGGVEAVFCVKALEDGFIPATVGLTTPDPECDLDYTPNTGRDADLTYALSNSLGFGGHNACLIFAKNKA